MVTTPYVYVTVGACLLGTCLNSVSTIQKQRLTEHRWRLRAKGKGCGGRASVRDRGPESPSICISDFWVFNITLPKVDGDPANASCLGAVTDLTHRQISACHYDLSAQSPVGWTTNLIVTGLWSFSGKSYDQWNFKKPDHVKQHSYNPWSRIFILIFFFVGDQVQGNTEAFNVPQAHYAESSGAQVLE